MVWPLTWIMHPKRKKKVYGKKHLNKLGSFLWQLGPGSQEWPFKDAFIKCTWFLLVYRELTEPQVIKCKWFVAKFSNVSLVGYFSFPSPLVSCASMVKVTLYWKGVELGFYGYAGVIVTEPILPANIIEQGLMVVSVEGVQYLILTCILNELYER